MLRPALADTDEKIDLHPEPVDGQDDQSSTGSAGIEDAERTGSTRIDELQLSAEPVEGTAMDLERVEGPDGVDSPDSTRVEPDREQVR